MTATRVVQILSRSCCWASRRAVRWRRPFRRRQGRPAVISPQADPVTLYQVLRCMPQARLQLRARTLRGLAPPWWTRQQSLPLRASIRPAPDQAPKRQHRLWPRALRARAATSSAPRRRQRPVHPAMRSSAGSVGGLTSRSYGWLKIFAPRVQGLAPWRRRRWLPPPQRPSATAAGDKLRCSHRLRTFAPRVQGTVPWFKRRRSSPPFRANATAAVGQTLGC
mmetsp:Transcript_114233/g.323011  ORF Transcript_114233/g.323011 Transcript_114233/m.323011 type:complete len:222 (+) Transcript_114233:101-766(+)